LAEYYISDRFSEPLWAMAHQKEVDFINAELSTKDNLSLLDLATGPARIAADLDTTPMQKAIAADYSKAMLDIAEKRLSSNTWNTMQVDAFDVPFEPQSFDVITTFRFLRHYENTDRARLYEQISNILKPNGLLIFDVLNQGMLRGNYIEKFTGAWDKSIVDITYTWDDIVTEMEEFGFEQAKHVPILNNWQALRSKQNELQTAKTSYDKIVDTLKQIDQIETTSNFMWITSWKKHA